MQYERPSTAEAYVLLMATDTGSHSSSAETRWDVRVPTAGLDERLWLVLGASALVVVVTSMLIATTIALGVTGGPSAEPAPGLIYGASAVGLLAGVGLCWWQFDAAERRAAFPLSRPSRAELGWTLVFLPLGIGGFLAGEQVAALLGFDLPTFYAYDLTDPTTALGVVLGAVLVAPLAEELLFRGALVGAVLESRGSVVLAGAVSVGLFAGYHVFALGVAGVFAIAGWAIFPTILRFRFDNLAGAWLLHLLNNLYAYVVIAVLAS
ncbi:Abi/CAAX domain protein [Natrialba magadii ATCC 43099]|uniref:Abi/CAAX domain protein n=1 Tax=Natrialba magadii (strain ATCC 43099 / DSM 3394 / CCM 3739 / CIP 104546 / IAM 13178 / JCM 8861 / NBRC 102185 / NCIMB 2190 / MS3) TaxID=547559 RepID=D3SYM0_NATMM|nr:type II CAAX endopeptidase family protein [Natrialba magadii]ADD04131.1 Abi/CAAX domain protein [Natrialba magadii ATCC 43099]ELY32916.1 hypothetical protein C500_03129 [Natrialba magadii ATCC 43099]